jgi:hypothetical protein
MPGESAADTCTRGGGWMTPPVLCGRGEVVFLAEVGEDRDADSNFDALRFQRLHVRRLLTFAKGPGKRNGFGQGLYAGGANTSPLYARIPREQYTISSSVKPAKGGGDTSIALNSSRKFSSSRVLAMDSSVCSK